MIYKRQQRIGFNYLSTRFHPFLPWTAGQFQPGRSSVEKNRGFRFPRFFQPKTARQIPAKKLQETWHLKISATPKSFHQARVALCPGDRKKCMKMYHISTLTFWTLEISRVRMQTPGLPVTWGKIPGFSNKSWVCRKKPGFFLFCRNFQFFLGWGGRCLAIHMIKLTYSGPFLAEGHNSTWLIYA